MFKIKIRFVDGSSLDYRSQDKEELNKIMYNLDDNAPLSILEGNRTILIVPRNILFLDIMEVSND